MRIGDEYTGNYDKMTYKVVSEVTNIGGVTAVALLREDCDGFAEEVYVKSLAEIERNWTKVQKFVSGYYRRKNHLAEANRNLVRWFDEMEPNCWSDFERVTVEKAP